MAKVTENIHSQVCKNVFPSAPNVKENVANDHIIFFHCLANLTEMTFILLKIKAYSDCAMQKNDKSTNGIF